MFLLDWTASTPAENLACDEALLDMRESAPGMRVLRFWEPVDYWVVVGYGNRIAEEVNVRNCELDRIPIHRRCSGGGTILQGPGCLNYSLVLPIQDPGLESIGSTNELIMEKHAAALSEFEATKVEGVSDLAVRGRKVSGNAQRRKRFNLLYHGTFLINFDLRQIARFLRFPSRQPAYRAGREHLEFLTNLRGGVQDVKRALRRCWGAEYDYGLPPMEAIGVLVRERYGTEQWNRKF